MLLQYAIQQSLLESTARQPSRVQEEEYVDILEQIESVPVNPETDFYRAIRDSQVEEDRRRREDEQYEEDLRKVLELSKAEQ